jgi:transposase
MSNLSIAGYFPFPRVVLDRQSVGAVVEGEQAHAVISATPSQVYNPKCSVCGSRTDRVHSVERRPVRDLDLGQHRIYINCQYRKLFCSTCHCVRVEDLDFFEPYQRITKRLACYIQQLCRRGLTVKQVAQQVGVDWKVVKRLEQADLEARYGQTDYEGLSILAIDEIAVRKGHHYMTVILDYETGRVVWTGSGRTKEVVLGFFAGMTQLQRDRVVAVAMDMWPAFIGAVQEALPQAKIVFDGFHVVASFGKVIDEVRKDEYRKASAEDKAVLKGSRFLLLKNDRNIKRGNERAHLNRLLVINVVISQVLILRDKLKMLWRYRKSGWARRMLDEWCALARAVGHPALIAFANMLTRHAFGVINHCAYPIHTSKLEGVNNKIKVTKRQAYGFRDDRYFGLKIIAAFASTD